MTCIATVDNQFRQHTYNTGNGPLRWQGRLPMKTFLFFVHRTIDPFKKSDIYRSQREMRGKSFIMEDKDSMAQSGEGRQRIQHVPACWAIPEAVFLRGRPSWWPPIVGELLLDVYAIQYLGVNSFPLKILRASFCSYIKCNNGGQKHGLILRHASSFYML